jgi:alpha,alpha-trehalase
MRNSADSRQPISIPDAEAAIFDLDGVITRTAGIHARAWKELFDDYLARHAAQEDEPFQPFDAVEDYRRYVDGKPRYEGVRSFLESRGIILTYGAPDDPPDRETICGLGNRKNDLFRERIHREGVEVFESSVAFIRALRSRGVRTALVSSSRNAAAILSAAGLNDLFDVCIDGVEAARLGLQGKPAPDTFLEAAKKLDVDPAHALVVEDAVAGVRAGRAGGFGLVVGVDRAGRRTALQEGGGDVVVADLAEILPLLDASPRVRKAGDRPDALDRLDLIAARLHDRRPVVFLDYDGTLTPIAVRFDLTALSSDMRVTLAALAAHCTVVVISGRDRADVEALVGLDGLYYAGSHGFDITGPGGFRQEYEAGTAFLPMLDWAEAELGRALGGIDGALVERKRFAIAVHYRLVAAPSVMAVEETVDRCLGNHPELRKTYGKKIFELRPRLDWDKGRAVRWLLEALEPDPAGTLPFYLGDDDTDEDAFKALPGQGISILVVDNPDRLTAADYALADTDAVRRFLRTLATLLENRAP